MNPNTGEIVYGDAEVIDQHGKEHGVQMVPVPEGRVAALNNMSPQHRRLWARVNRLSLQETVDAGIELTPTQSKALSKQERKRQRRLKELARAKK